MINILHYLAPIFMSPIVWIGIGIIIGIIVFEYFNNIFKIIGSIIAILFCLFVIYDLGMAVCEGFHLFGW